MEKSDGEDTYTASCERVLFLERSEVLEMLHKLAAKESNVQDAAAGERGSLLEKVASCLEKYLEQPHLLDPHLDAMINVVMGRAKELILEREAEVFGHLAASSGGGDGRPCPRPGETFPFQVFISPQLHAMFCVVYQLCRVRGAKAIVRLMPHEAAELEPVIHALQAQDTDDYSTWETRYGLLLWLSMLSLVPFDIDSIDSGFDGSSGLGSSCAQDTAGATCGDEKVSGGGGARTGSGSEGGGQGRRDQQPQQQRPTDLVGTILSLGMKHLGDAGPTRDAAAACLGCILTRPDMEARHLQQFLEWGASVVGRVARDAKEGREDFGESSFLVMGVMATLAALFKQGHREKLVGLIPVVFYPVIDLAELGSGQTLLRKMIVKVLQRIGMTYLPPRVVSWRYQRGQRSLLQNLGTSTADEASLAGNQGAEEDGDFELEFDVPAELEGIVEALLCGLRDRDTVVRWSAAKGVGRITGRLPRELADDVVCSVLDLFVEAEGDGSWHGGCLALAELARRGLLVPERLPRACPLVQRALAYDVRRGAGGVGSHVRDAACYVCWAFARAYSPQVLGPHLPGLCDSLLAAALLDREVNVRRAAAAAFQENVGRQGQCGDGDQGNGVAHGIAIITVADYFSLGNRQQAFLQISQAVAKFPRYRHQLLDWLRLNRLRHWDPEIRRLSAISLHNLTALEPGYIADTVLPATLKESLSPDLVRRHGACLAAAEITLALGKVPHAIPSETLEDLVEVVPALEKARLYRGRGGELMRQAACRVVEALALIKAGLSVKAQVRMLDSIDESLRHPVEAVQLSAVAALKAVLRNWFPVGAGGPSDRLQTRVTKNYIAGLRTEDNAAAARGYALALGVLPRKIAGASRSVIEDVLGALRDAAIGRHSPAESCRPSPSGAESEGADGSQGGKEKFEFGTGPGGELDAETRRNAIRGLIQVCEELGVGVDGGSGGDHGDGGDGGDADRILGNANAEVRPGGGKGGAPSSSGGRGVSQGRPAHVSDINRNGERGKGDYGEGHDSTPMEDKDPSPGATGTHQIDAEDTKASLVAPEKEGVDGHVLRSGTRSWHPQGLTVEDVEGVLGTLLAATEDYSVDNRGDVGSWCRIEALGALERLARLTIKASKGFPLKDRGDDADLSPAELLRRPETDYARLAAAGTPVPASTTFGEATIVGSRAGGEVLEVRYDPPSLGSFHFPYGTALLNRRDAWGSGVHRLGKAATFMVPRIEDRLAFLDEPPGPVPKKGCHPCDRIFFTPVMMERLVCAVLKQLSEKLDSVRERAGTVLESIVHGENPRLPFIPRKEAIVHVMEGFDEPAMDAGAGGRRGRGAAGNVNWASPAATFPMVVALLAVPEYHDAVVSGLVVSVGGLSESVVKQSSSALLRWVKVCKNSGNKRALVALGNSLVTVFGRASGDARVALPLLKTIEMLLSNDSFDFLYTEEHPLPESLRAAIVLMLKGCRDVTKLCLGASVLVCMLDFGDPTRSKALRNSVMLLAHRFPNVRKATAEALYLKLLAAEELVSPDAQEEVLDILSSTPWDNDLDTAKAARSKLGKLLSVEVPQVTKPLVGEDASGASSASAVAKKDEMESYESLVRTAGY